MVSDQEIAKGVESLLRQSDPNSVTTLNGVVQQLEAKLGVDLSQKASFIWDQMNLIVRSAAQQQQAQQQQQQRQVNVPPKDHFTPQHHPQFPTTHHHHQQQFHPYLALQQHFRQQQLHQHRFPEDLNFGNPLPSPPQQQQTRAPPPQQRQPVPQVVKAEATSGHSASGNASDAPKESAPTKKRGGAGGLNKVCGVSPELQAVVGEPALPRTEIVKQLWAYIRKNNLQDPSNKRKIICDDALRVVFETDSTDMFKMNKLLSKHIIRLEPTKESGPAKRLKVNDEPATQSTESGPLSVGISEALANFIGTGDREMLQSEVVGRVWEYIKVNHLEDPLNSMVILCDDKLRGLLGCESISALGVSEMLARHHLFKQ